MTQLWKTYTHWRIIAKSARKYTNQSIRLFVGLEVRAAAAKKGFFQAVCAQKKKHWAEFLDNVQNIWQAAKFLDPGKLLAFANISYLEVKGSDHNAETKTEIAETLIKTFFPPGADLAPPVESMPNNQLA